MTYSTQEEILNEQTLWLQSLPKLRKRAKRGEHLDGGVKFQIAAGLAEENDFPAYVFLGSYYGQAVMRVHCTGKGLDDVLSYAFFFSGVKRLWRVDPDRTVTSIRVEFTTP